MGTFEEIVLVFVFDIIDEVERVVFNVMKLRESRGFRKLGAMDFS
jgi:hypothetical protein